MPAWHLGPIHRLVLVTAGLAACAPGGPFVASSDSALLSSAPASCPSGVSPADPNSTTMAAPHIVHRYFGDYWTHTSFGLGEASAQSAKWQRIISDPAYFAPLAQYSVGQGTWSTPAQGNPADAQLTAGTLVTDQIVGQMLVADAAYDAANGVPPLDPDNTVYVVYFGPAILHESLFYWVKDPTTGVSSPDLTRSRVDAAFHHSYVGPDPYHPGKTRQYHWAAITYWTATNSSETGQQLLAQGPEIYGQLADTIVAPEIDVQESHEIDEALTDSGLGYRDVNLKEIGDKCGTPSYFDGAMINMAWSNADCACIDRKPQPAVPAVPSNCVYWANCGGAASAHCDNQLVDHVELRRRLQSESEFSVVSSTANTTSPPAIYLSDSTNTSGQVYAFYEMCAMNVAEKGNCTGYQLVIYDDTPCGGDGAPPSGGPTSGPGGIGRWHGHVLE